MNTKFQFLTRSSFLHFLVVISLASISIFYSCTEEASLLGADLIPENDKIGYIYDDTTLSFSSYLVNQTRFYSKNYSTYYLGLVNSTYYGSTEGRIASQFEPVNYVWVYDSAVIDSIVLFLQVDTTFGIKDINFPINIYELDSAISEDPIYYSDYNMDNMYSIANKLNTGYRIQGDTLLAFPLDIDIANRIAADSSAHKDDSLFLDTFKGISIIPENVLTNGGQLFNVNISNAQTKLVIYYNDTLSFPYYLNKGERFGTYKNNPENSILQAFMENDSTEIDSLLFVQGLGGVTSKLILSNYMDLINKANYSILKAELIMPIFDTGEPEEYPFPDQLYFTHLVADSIYSQIVDASSGKLFDGKLNATDYQYSFDISLYLKSLLNGQSTDSCLVLKIPANTSEANRVILKAGENIKLKVTYSKH
ncbi:MAG: hypothetical protein A2W99_10590 [Bacteroidetes bacterium GWF2_33_16]|nr:MAG: hypothetical protein A2X00_05150 [Bacteroidetes bacterium GWE2_32_14]OFY03989.1 MAG: hypothetical protein A2W99_10590 [Bacteroidetes bacterium GWF2_33_16]